MASISEKTLREHLDHTLTVTTTHVTEGARSRMISIQLTCVTCRRPVEDWEGAYTPCDLVTIPVRR